MITFNEFLTEGTASWDGMRFTVNSVSSRAGLTIQFLPDSQTLDKASKADLAAAIKTKLDKKMPIMSEAFYNDTSFEGAGIAFTLDPYEFSNIISKQLK
jgi:hypothetical protein